MIGIAVCLLWAGAACAAPLDPYISATLSMRGLLTHNSTIFVAGLTFNKPLTQHLIFNMGVNQTLNTQFDPTFTVGFTFRLGRSLKND
jgi:hypothetical protein